MNGFVCFYLGFIMVHSFLLSDPLDSMEGVEKWKKERSPYEQLQFENVQWQGFKSLYFRWQEELKGLDSARSSFEKIKAFVRETGTKDLSKSLQGEKKLPRVIPRPEIPPRPKKQEISPSEIQKRFEKMPVVIPSQKQKPAEQRLPEKDQVPVKKEDPEKKQKEKVYIESIIKTRILNVKKDKEGQVVDSEEDPDIKNLLKEK